MREDLRALRRALGLLGTRARSVVLAVAWGSLALGAAVGLAAVSAWLIARASQMPPVLDLTVAVVAVRALGISRGVFRYLERIASHDVALRGIAHLREGVYTRLAAGRAWAVAGLRRGDLLARFGADVDAIGDVVVKALVPAAVAGVVGIGSVALVGALSPGTGAVLALMLLLAGVGAPWLAARAAAAAERATVTARADVSAASLGLLDDAAQLRVAGRLDEALDAVGAADARLARAQRTGAWATASAHGLATLAMGVTVVAALLIGIPAVAAGTLAPVELSVIVLTPLAAFEGVAALPAAAVQVLRSAQASRRVLALLDEAGEPGPQPPPPALDASRGVVARDLAIGWPGGPVLARGLDLEVRPGRAIAVVGASGIGKTTLLATLAGLLPARGGAVEIGGADAATLPDGAAAGVVVFTAEDAHVFDTTVLENLRVARGDVTPEQARDALVRSGLGDLLGRLPDGLDTRLGADATMVSGGERRRLLLARALLAPAPVMLLDEPGEHLDLDTADALVADVLRTGRAGGVLVVTHRPEGVTDADLVLDLSDPSPREPR